MDTYDDYIDKEAERHEAEEEAKAAAEFRERCGAEVGQSLFELSSTILRLQDRVMRGGAL